MTKHLHLKKVLATLLTIAAVFAGQQAFATITDFMSIRGQSANINGQYYYVWSISGFMGQYPQPKTEGNSYTFNGQSIGLDRGNVHITGTLNFAESNELTDVTTGSQVTIVFSSDQFWFYGATVKKLDGTNVTGCSASASSDHTSITVTIPSGKTFGNIYLDFVAYEPFYNYNTTISGVESTYIYTGRPIEPVPTVTYNGRTLTAGTDYTVSYSNTTGPGSASVTVTGTGQYAGTVTRNYNIRAVALTDFNSLGSNTYAIATTADLDHLAAYVNLGNECQGLTFKQTADIAYTYTTTWNSSTGGETNFTAIGGWGRPFKGTFDGQNHSISGIRISKNGQTDSAKCQGLFGFVYTSGTVRNVILADTRIQGYTGTGGIVGVNSGTIEDCRVQGNVLVKSSGIGTNTVTSDDGSDFGGIAGSNNGGTVTRCTSSVTIDGYLGFYIHHGNNTINNYSNNLGGVVGNNSGTVSNCLALNAAVTGDLYAAAIVGENNGTLTANHYRGCTVTNDNHSNGSSIGVGVGTNDGSEDQDGARSVHALTLGTDITATGESVVIDGTTYYASNTTVTLGNSGTVPAGQMPVYSVNGTAIEGNTFTMPTNDNATVSATFVSAWSGSGTSGSPYVITTTAQLDALAAAVKSGETYSGTYFVLGNDIAYSTEGLGDTDENFTTIGGYFDGSDKNFSGTFDGQGHTISGIRLYKTGNSNPSKNQGLFGRISGATIKNVILTDARITGYRYVGGIVGNKASGTVQNCLVLESTITCENTYVGALFGGNSGTIAANYYHNCTVNGTNNATNVGVGGNGGVSASSDTDGARSVHTLTIQNGDITATGSTVAYQGTTWYASTTTVTLGYNNLLEGCVATYSLDGNVLTGNTFTMPAADATVNGTFVSHWHADADHDGTTEERAYIITTTAGLDLLATKVNGGTDYYHKFFKLGADIAYDGTENNYTAIGNSSKYFIGTFDGDGYAVSGIHINTSGNYQGLFGYVGYTGTVKNVTLRSSTITGMNYVGGIVGFLYRGTVTDCRVESTVTIGTYDNGSKYHGGIVGASGSATVNGCISAATVTNNGKSGCYYYGGIVGQLSDGTVSNNLALGATVSANNYKGAIVGYRSNGTLANNYYHGCTVNGATSGIGTNSGDVSEDDGAVQVFSLTLGEGITATPAPAVTCNGINYYTTGTEITLNANAGYAITSATLTYGGNDYPIVGNSFEMPAQDVAVTAVLQVRYTFDSNTGALTLLFGEFNKDNNWGNDVDPSAVTSVTATNEVSFTGDCSYLFQGFTNCTSMDLTDVNTANVTNMSYMFYGCSGLQSLNVSGWNTTNVTDMSYIFRGCFGLQSLDLSGWNTANVTNMSGMFYGCSGLQSLNISSWNTANVTNMQYMFYCCSGLQSLNFSGWNTANVTDMSYMFEGCSGLQSLDLSGWNTANVTDMSYMFYSFWGLQSLDLTGWNTANVSDMSGMFLNCTDLATIYVGEGWNTIHVVIQHSSNMFTNCTSLVGGMGTTYNSNHTNAEYARIDGGPDNPGYFTGRFTKEIAGYGNDENPGGYYLIASPVPSITPTLANGFITDDNTNPDNRTYDLYYFDQTGDANGKEWKNYRAHPEFTSLVSGQGYLYASKNGTTLLFSGAPYSGEGQVDLTYSEDNEDQGMWGWNLIGNPFAETANLPSGLSYYTLNDTRSELIAGNASTIGAMEAIFVKATGTGQSVQFTKQSRGGISRGSTAAVNAILSLNLTDNHNRLIDRAIVRFDEGQPLPKFQIRETSTKVYIPQKGKDYAVINVCTDGACTVSTEMPVNFKAEENGEYTITVNIDNVEVNYLHLIDNLTGNDVDMLALNGGDAINRVSTYTFKARTTDYESRFKLVFICGDTNDDNDGDNATFAFYSNGNWIIANEGEATLQVVDMMGRILSSETISGSINKAIDAVPGMYVLRLVNGNDIKTQKIVVK